ncbi:MAG: hypothetical protein Q8835_03205, partial [Sweet potato little leaf phytoplasma]|nr:hypothetical protein [Sweet potato little leaf phytoplasma]
SSGEKRIEEEKEDEEAETSSDSDSETESDSEIRELDGDQVPISAALRRKRKREIKAGRRKKNKNDPIFAKRSRTRSMDASPVVPPTISPAKPKGKSPKAASPKNPFPEVFRDVNFQERMEIMKKRDFLNEKGFSNRAGALQSS